jgi:alkanesulfonate monooxygenase SsuD/methylene tetrahydromethanopterin reductase-like flavin-dependent oxidoreductase (luciferase family)
VTLGLNSREGEIGARRLAEGLQVCRAMLEDDRPEFTGHVYQIRGAINLPLPMQGGGVPLVVFLDGGDQIEDPARMDGLRIAAQHADALVVGGDTATVQEAVGVAASSGNHRHSRPASESIGSSDSGMSRVIWIGTLLVDPDTDSAAGNVQPGGIGAQGPPTQVISGAPALSGSPAQVAEEVRQRTLAGADGCIVSLAGGDQLEAISRYGPVLLEAIESTSTGPASGNG